MGVLIYTRVKPDELEYSQKLYSLQRKTYTSKPSVSPAPNLANFIS